MSLWEAWWRRVLAVLLALELSDGAMTRAVLFASSHQDQPVRILVRMLAALCVAVGMSIMVWEWAKCADRAAGVKR